jgi:hypothetical protein
MQGIGELGNWSLVNWLIGHWLIGSGFCLRLCGCLKMGDKELSLPRSIPEYFQADMSLSQTRLSLCEWSVNSVFCTLLFAKNSVRYEKNIPGFDQRSPLMLFFTYFTL